MENELLKILGKDKLEELISRYYSEEKVSDLIEEFELDVKVSGLLKLFPLKVLDNDRCPYCNKAMHQRYTSKSTSKYQLPSPFCDKCDHEKKENCSCKSCVVIRKAKRDQLDFNYRKQILNMQYKNNNQTALSDLSLRQALYLVAFCRVGRNIDSDSIHALYFCDSKLSPTSLLDDEILDLLYKDQLIDINESTIHGVVNFENKKPSYILDSCEWSLNFSSTQSLNINLIERLEIMIRDRNLWPLSWYEELLSIWKELAVHECLSYMRIQFEEHHFELRVGKKTIKVMKEVVENYPILKCYYFIWYEVKVAVSYMVQKKISPRQAANSIVGNLQQKVERALSEKWDIKEFSKNPKHGDSVLTALFSNVVTNISKDFFKVTPNNKSLGILESKTEIGLWHLRY